MRSFLLAIFSMAFHIALGQAPQGHFFTTAPCGNQLSVTQLPSGGSSMLDSLGGTDMLIHGDRLFVAGTYSCIEASNVFVYDLPTNSLDTILPVNNARSLAVWEDRLLVSSTTAPFLHAFDLDDGLMSVFSILDSSKVHHGPNDLEVAGDRAFLLLMDRVVVVDLDIEDTIAVVATPPPFSFGGSNHYFIPAGEELFFEIEYFTGALRSSLSKINTQTLAYDTVYHAEGYGNWISPIRAKNDIHLYNFGSYYSIPGDSLHLEPYGLQRFPLAYDDPSETFFVKGPQDSLFIWQQGQYIDTLLTGNPNQIARFQALNNTAIGEPKERLRLKVFPNPSSKKMWVQLPSFQEVKSVKVLNSKGQIVSRQSQPGFLDVIELNLTDLPRGGYFVQVQLAQTVITEPIVKW